MVDKPAAGGRLVAHWRLVGAAAIDPATSKADIAVLWSVLQMINSKTGTTFPSMERIAEAAEVKPRTAYRAIKSLCDRGYLEKTTRRGRGGDRSNLYCAGTSNRALTHSTIPDNYDTDKPITDKPITDKPITDKLVTDKPISDGEQRSNPDKIRSPSVTSLSDLSSSKSNQLQRAISSRAELGFVLKDGSKYVVSDRDAAMLSRAHPGVDLTLELRKMEAWAEAHPRRRKTNTGALRFVQSWIARAVPRIGAASPLPADARSDDTIEAANAAALARLQVA